MVSDERPEQALAQEPEVWRQQAHHLKMVSEVLWEHIRTSFDAGQQGAGFERRWMLPQYSLLIGFAFENLIKGLFVRSYPARFAFKLNWDTGNGHELIALAQAAGITLTNEDEQLLDVLEETISWVGRYPTRRQHAGAPIATGPLLPSLFEVFRPMHEQVAEYKTRLEGLWDRVDALYREAPM